MAQTGYTPIQLYYSSTTTNAPTAGNLASGELAINITDGKLFYKDNSNAVQVIGWKTTPTSAGGTGLTSYTAGDTLYYASGTMLTKLAIGATDYVMTSSGSAPQWSASLKAIAGGTGQTSYAIGDLLYANTTTTLAKLADVATGNALISGGVGVAPSWGKIGLTTHVSGTLPIANGGTNMTIAPPMFAAYSDSTQTPASATATKVIFGTESFDTNNNFASSRFTATIAGYYQFSACASCSADVSLTKVLLQFYKNGAAQVDIVATSLSSATSLSTDAPSAFSTSSLVYLAATDYVEVYATVTGTGGNRYIFASNAGYPTVFTGALIR